MHRSLLLFALALVSLAHAREHVVLLGTYTGGESRGIYRVRFDDETGALSPAELAAEAPNPSFLALHPNGRVVYALNETDTRTGKGGAVTAFTVDTATGALTKLNTETTGNRGLAHLNVDTSGRMVVVASYSGGYITAFPLEADGRLKPHTALIEHKGQLGPKTKSQNAPHPHSITFSPDNRIAFVADLGLDRILAYDLDPAAGTLAVHEPPYVALAPGAGPRHSKFSHDGKNFYVIDELDATVTAFRYDASQGKLTPFQQISTLPPDYTGMKSCSEIRIHPNDRFVYAGNRGHDSIAVFARDPSTGELTLVEIVPTGGKTPRNFALSPDGAWLISAHQDSNDLTVFKVDPNTGRLTSTPHTTKAQKPVCVLFLN